MSLFVLQSIPVHRLRETQLLIDCARCPLDPETSAHIRHLAGSPIDWEYLLAAAARHRTLPLLYRNLEKSGTQDVPDKIGDRLQANFKLNTRRNLMFSGKLLKLLKQLNVSSIPAIPFKGPALAEYVYRDMALRQFNDLDILVRQQDAVRARNLLLANGYRPEIRLNDSQFKAFVKLKNSAPFTGSDGKIAVDLHWEMTGRYSLLPFDFETLENRVVHANLAGMQIHHLCPEDLLLYLCHHGALHCWNQLEMISSLGALIRSHADMNWRRVKNLATELHCERIVCLGLFMAHDLLQVPLPEKVIDMLNADPKTPEIALGRYKNLFNPDSPSGGNGISSKFSGFHLQVRERLSEKIRYGLLLATLPTKEEWRRLPLPASLSALLYVFRPLRLATELGQVLLKRCFINS